MENESVDTELPSFGRYQTFRLLGEGATAGVFLAKDPHLSRRVAIKVIKAHLLESEAVLARFRTEASVLANLRHANILQVYDYDMEGDLHYLVMEYVEGPGFQSLLDRQAGRPLPQEIAAHLIRQAALGLAEAHKQGLVHRDIKPDNMLLTTDGVLKIADFGIAHIADLGLTQAGDILGTPYYMAPEQTMAETPVPQTDLWALGVVLYQCLTGRRPFEGANFTEIKRRIRAGIYIPVTERVPDIDPELIGLVDSLLAQEPETRGTALGLAQRLDAWLDKAGIADWDAHLRDFLARSGVVSLDRTTVEFQAAATPLSAKASRWKTTASPAANPAPAPSPTPVVEYPTGWNFFKRNAWAYIFPILMVVGINVYVRWSASNPPTPAQANGILQLSSSPAGAAIRLNGDELGLTPINQILKVGPYTLRLTHSAFPGKVKDTVVTLEEGINKVSIRFSP
jgi:serine/threonine protein kinase